jgi:mitotic spindle assembly checkpoint protein MAD2
LIKLCPELLHHKYGFWTVLEPGSQIIILQFNISIDWLFEKTVKKLVIVVINIDTHEPLERWQFDVECDKTMTETR